MALNARKSLQLDDVELDDFYVKEQTLWSAMAKDAYGYALKGVQKTGEPMRPDDVVDLLKPALEIAQPLRVFLADKKLRQKFWYEWFAEYIIDREWASLP